MLKRGLSLSNKPYEAYTGQGVVGTTADQNTAYGNIRSNQGNYQPFFDTAAGSVNRIAGMDPTGAGMPYITQAGNMTTGTEAASPFVSQASKTFPGSVNEYMSPYTDQVVKGIQDASNRNFEQNTLKNINDTFSGGNAAQFAPRAAWQRCGQCRVRQVAGRQRGGRERAGSRAIPRPAICSIRTPTVRPDWRARLGSLLKATWRSAPASAQRRAISRHRAWRLARQRPVLHRTWIGDAGGRV